MAPKYLMRLMNYGKLLAIYDGLKVVKGEVNIAWSTHQSWSTFLLVKYKTKFFTFTFSLVVVYQLIAANWTAPRQDKTLISPSDIESTSIRLSRSALQQLRKILLSCYWLN
jgi:hypothetical protein